MFQIAIQSLLFDRRKLVAALAGVAFAATLVVVQLGLYQGFLSISSQLISRVGGDLWVMAKGTEVIDNAETISAGTRAVAASQPCVEQVRGMILAWAFVRKSGTLVTSVNLIGYDSAPHDMVPWTLNEGLPGDLHRPMRVAVDATELRKLRLPDHPIGSSLLVNGKPSLVTALSKGIRSFTLFPYVFADLGNARRIAGIAEGDVTFWIVTVKEPGCVALLKSLVQSRSDLQIKTTGEFREMTESYWVGASGVGAVLTFSASLGLIVGVVLVGQTLFSMTRDHAKELATWKAMGASSLELVQFVGWQAAFLAVVGSALGMAAALALQRGGADVGLPIVYTPGVLLRAAAAIVAMCAFASFGSVRSVLKLDPFEVLL
ncbi:ABC transporter permease [Pendulispora albinea]|uniref:ABC transporter permease n=1 Tax=Pendulispora albinea TaxID=2741071 RepID=A0ABZ2M531_9BACT